MIQSQTKNTDEKNEKLKKGALGEELLVVGIGRRSVGLTWYLFSLVKGKKGTRRASK